MRKLASLVFLIVISAGVTTFASRVSAQGSPAASAESEMIPYAGDVDDPNGVGRLPKRYALVIGVGDYEPTIKNMEPEGFDPWPMLPKASADAWAVGKFLHEKAGFKTIWLTTRDENDKFVRYVHKSDILNSVSHLMDLIKADEGNVNRRPVILFYFAGHGTEFLNKDYFLPSEFRPKYADDVELMGVSINDIETRLNWGAPGLQIILADACRTLGRVGKLTWGKDGSDAGTPTPVFQGPPPPSVPWKGFNDILVAYTALAGAPAEDGKLTSKEGPFRDALVSVFGTYYKHVKDAGSGREHSLLTTLLDKVETKLQGESVNETLQIDTKGGGKDFVLFPTKADYEAEKAIWEQYKPTELEISKPRASCGADNDRIISRKRYCFYNHVLTDSEQVSPLSYYGGYPNRMMRKLAVDNNNGSR